MKRVLPYSGWAALGLLLFFSFALDLENVSEGGSIDLRNRITGVRLLLEGIDPYHYKWDESQPEIDADPFNNPQIPVSKTTASPALLLTHAPLSPLPYRVGQFLWFFIQWFLLVGAGFVWWRHMPSARRPVLALFLVGFTFTAASRLHVERGQAYLILLIALAGWFSLTLSQRAGRDFWAGLLAGWLVALRPSFFFLLPFVLWHRRGQTLGALTGLILGVGLPLFWNSGCWNDYFSAMRTHAFFYTTESEPRPGPQHFPPTIEGVPTDILGHYAVIPYADFSAYRLTNDLGIFVLPSWVMLLIPTIGFAVWLRQTRHAPLLFLLTGLAAWLFLTDLFLPAYRNSYNDVLAINLVALALLAERPRHWALGCFLVALPLGWSVYWFMPETPWIINLPTLLFVTGAVLLLFGPPKVAKAN